MSTPELYIRRTDPIGQINVWLWYLLVGYVGRLWNVVLQRPS